MLSHYVINFLWQDLLHILVIILLPQPIHFCNRKITYVHQAQTFGLQLTFSSLCPHCCCYSSFLNLGLMSNDINDKTPSDYEVTGEVSLETAQQCFFSVSLFNPSGTCDISGLAFYEFSVKHPVFIPFQGLREAIKGGDIKAVKKLLSQVLFLSFLSFCFCLLYLIFTITLHCAGSRF